MRSVKAGLVFNIIPLVIAALLQGCGYGFYASKSPWLEREGVRAIYIRPIRNGTYKPGVENTVYNALLKTLQTNRKIRIVQREEEADAILSGAVDSAAYSPGPTVGVSTLRYGDQLRTTFQAVSIPTTYYASLGCSFALTLRSPQPGKSSGLWSGGFGRSKPFPATNQLDVLGTTSALINETEFDRALGDLAKLILVDMHEDMLSQF